MFRIFIEIYLKFKNDSKSRIIILKYLNYSIDFK